jgi:hypothetical protein
LKKQQVAGVMVQSCTNALYLKSAEGQELTQKSKFVLLVTGMKAA